MTLATGGTVIDAGGFRHHIFTSSDVLTVTAAGDVELLMVAGGGGGAGVASGLAGGGGGGAGGLIHVVDHPLAVGSYPVVVGKGGLGGVGNDSTNGEDSSFNGLVAVGGGKGSGVASFSIPAGSGGSGGGGARDFFDVSSPGAGIPGQGHDGSFSSAAATGGSGGGASEPGRTVDDPGGGNGVYIDWADAIGLGDDGYFAGGGGGGSYNAGAIYFRPGGLGGGGDGGQVHDHGNPGVDGTGGGGGGAGGTQVVGVPIPGGDGGDGIVVVRYVLDTDLRTEADLGDLVAQATVREVDLRLGGRANLGSLDAVGTVEIGDVNVLHADPVELTLEVFGTLGVGTPAGGGVYPNPESEPGWSGRIVDMFGGLIADLPDISVETLIEELNEPDMVRFRTPKVSTTFKLWVGQEVQIWRNQQLMFWGPILHIASSGHEGDLVVEAASTLWYFRRLFFGTAERGNKIKNPTFDDGLTHWVPVRIDAQAVTTGTIIRGNGAVVLTNPQEPNAYLSQTYQFSTNFPFGMWFFVSAWVYIEEWNGKTEWTYTVGGEEFTVEPGLVVVHRTYPGAVVRAVSVAEITEDTPRGQWVRLNTRITALPFEEGTIEVRLYGVNGRVRWGAVMSVVPESTSTSPPDGTDQAELLRRVVTYAQTGRGKPELNIGTDTPNTGQIVAFPYSWQHEHHQPIWSAFQEFIDADNGVDISIEITPTTRTFTTHFPDRGVYRNLWLTTGEGGNLQTVTHDVDIARTSNSVVILGPSTGPSREEGGAIDPDTLPNGLILETVISAREVPIRQLDAKARSELELLKDPVEIVEAFITDRSLVGVLHPGDRINLEVDDNWLQLFGTWRIVRLRHVPYDPSGVVMVATLNKDDYTPPTTA